MVLGAKLIAFSELFLSGYHYLFIFKNKYKIILIINRYGIGDKIIELAEPAKGPSYSVLFFFYLCLVYLFF